MPDLRLPFRFYDPTTDQRLDPSAAELLFIHPRMPYALLHSVHQAKELIGALDVESIRTIADAINQLDMQAPLLRINQLKHITEKDHVYADDAENLRLVLANGEHDVPPQAWASYMGVLALSLAGKIYCELWPSQEYIEITAQEFANGEFHPRDDSHLQKLATIAAKAAAYGEAFKTMLDAKNAQIERSRQGGKLAHSDKQALADVFIQWAMALPQQHRYPSMIDGVIDFLKNHVPEKLKRFAGNDGMRRTLQRKLNEHVKLKGFDHPFPSNKRKKSS